MIVPTNNESFAHHSRYHQQLREIVSGAIGALDGTIVKAIVSPNEQTPFRGRGKGECYQNVLGVCDFDKIFTFVIARWEGVAHDSRVLTETIRDPTNNFPIPHPDKYYLCDAAYAHTRGFMAPYCNVSYWLADFRNNYPRTREELFNQEHAKMRNVIERTFGVLKSQFPILNMMPSYLFPKQRNILIACVAMHNCIRRVDNADYFFEEWDDDNTTCENLQGGNNGDFSSDQSTTRRDYQIYMVNLRDQVAGQFVLGS